MTPSTAAPGPGMNFGEESFRNVSATNAELGQHLLDGLDGKVGIRIDYLREAGLRLSTPQGAGAVAWRHTLHCDGSVMVRLTESPENPFGVPGKDYSEEFVYNAQALGPIAHPSPSSPNEGGYDEAVAAIAPYLPEWVHYVAFDTAFRMFGEHADPAPGPYCWSYVIHIDDPNDPTSLIKVKEFRFLNVPAPADWRTSLRRVVSGRVVNGGEG